MEEQEQDPEPPTPTQLEHFPSPSIEHPSSFSQNQESTPPKQEESADFQDASSANDTQNQREESESPSEPRSPEKLEIDEPNPKASPKKKAQKFSLPGRPSSTFNPFPTPQVLSPEILLKQLQQAQMENEKLKAQLTQVTGASGLETRASSRTIDVEKSRPNTSRSHKRTPNESQNQSSPPEKSTSFAEEPTTSEESNTIGLLRSELTKYQQDYRFLNSTLSTLEHRLSLLQTTIETRTVYTMKISQKAHQQVASAKESQETKRAISEKRKREEQQAREKVNSVLAQKGSESTRKAEELRKKEELIQKAKEEIKQRKNMKRISMEMREKEKENKRLKEEISKKEREREREEKLKEQKRIEKEKLEEEAAKWKGMVENLKNRIEDMVSLESKLKEELDAQEEIKKEAMRKASVSQNESQFLNESQYASRGSEKEPKRRGNEKKEEDGGSKEPKNRFTVDCFERGKGQGKINGKGLEITKSSDKRKEMSQGRIILNEKGGSAKGKVKGNETRQVRAKSTKKMESEVREQEKFLDMKKAIKNLQMKKEDFSPKKTTRSLSKGKKDEEMAKNKGTETKAITISKGEEVKRQNGIGKSEKNQEAGSSIKGKKRENARKERENPSEKEETRPSDLGENMIEEKKENREKREIIRETTRKEFDEEIPEAVSSSSCKPNEFSKGSEEDSQMRKKEHEEAFLNGEGDCETSQKSQIPPKEEELHPKYDELHQNGKEVHSSKEEPDPNGEEVDPNKEQEGFIEKNGQNQIECNQKDTILEPERCPPGPLSKEIEKGEKTHLKPELKKKSVPLTPSQLTSKNQKYFESQAKKNQFNPIISTENKKNKEPVIVSSKTTKLRTNNLASPKAIKTIEFTHPKARAQTARKPKEDHESLRTPSSKTKKQQNPSEQYIKSPKKLKETTGETQNDPKKPKM